MRTLTKEELNTEYLICKDLTPGKKYKTYLAMKEHSDGSLYSVILKEMDEKRSAIYEKLTGIWNPFIADTYDVFLLNDDSLTDTQKYIAVTECVYAQECPDEELLSLTQFVRKNGPLSEKTALAICSQICEGLVVFHNKGFVHRDLKPDNIMISKYDIEYPEIKIIDFGGAKKLKTEGLADTTVIGTLGYQAPESLTSHTTNQSDIFSIGCILNYMLTGQEPGVKAYTKNHSVVSIIEKATKDTPFYRYSNTEAMKKEIEHELRIRIWDKIPVVRSIPGYRSHTVWKELIASFVYSTLIFLSIVYPPKYGLRAFIELLGFGFIIPLILLCNMGNLLCFFPKKLRHNDPLFFMIRITLLLASLFIPLLTA